MEKVNNILSSNTITLARMLLALGTLSTLLFTNVNDLFPQFHVTKIIENKSGLMHLNYFLWFDNIYIPYTISIIILFLTILGVYPRIISILQCITSYSIFYTMLIVEGGDQINIILTLLLIPICILDNRKNGWKIIENKSRISSNGWLIVNAALAVFFIQFQMSILYFNAGIAKIYAPEWSNGTAVYYWFYDNTFGAPNWLRHSLGFLFKNGITVSIINWGVIILEIALFVALFLKQEYKYILFSFGIALHFFIILTHGLPVFFLSMAGGLILFLWNLEISVNNNIKQIKLLILKKVQYERNKTDK